MSQSPKAVETALGDLMRHKRWAEAQAFCDRHAALLESSSMHWAARHVAACLALPESAAHGALVTHDAVAHRLSDMKPSFALERAETVPFGYIALSCLRLWGRDRSTGKPLALFEKIYPAYRLPMVEREIALFDAIDADALMAPRLLAHHRTDHVIAVLYENAGQAMPPTIDMATLDRIRARHWQAHLPPPLRAPVTRHHKRLFDPQTLLQRGTRAQADPGQTAALAARLPLLARAFNALPQFPLHKDMKAANIVLSRQADAPVFDTPVFDTPVFGHTPDRLRVVDWEKWQPAPVGMGISLSEQALQDPAWRAQLDAQHPDAAAVAMLYALHHDKGPEAATVHSLIAALLKATAGRTD
ncbi:MAG: hypothetical protein JJU19_12265 [Pararhodobacter sp.]|nr:hypothetical protein [Pararhodobacter sp.]